MNGGDVDNFTLNALFDHILDGITGAVCCAVEVEVNLAVPVIHGHIHEQTLDPIIFKLENYFNVSVENINYTPIDLQEIIKRMDW